VRIALNVWFANQPTTGSGQYLTHLLAGYAERYRDHQFLLCGHTGQCPPSIHASRDHGSPSSLPPHFTWWRRGTPLDRVNRHLAKVWFEQLTFPSACRRWQADVIHVPYWGSPLRSSIPVVVTVHDLIPALLPAYRKGTKGRTYTALVSAAARRANTILTDSESSRQDIVQHLGIPPTRVRTVHLAADQLYASQPSAESDVDVRDRYGLPPR